MNTSRREFFKTSLAAVGGMLLFPLLGRAAETRRSAAPAPAAGGLPPLATPGQGPAAALNYQHHNTDVKDAKLKTERQGVPFAKQSCSGCQFFTSKTADQGLCQVLPGNSVKATGWCSSWAKKA